MIVFAAHKSGSSFLYKYFREVAHQLGVPYFSINNAPPNYLDYRKQGILCPERYLPFLPKTLDQSEQYIVQYRDIIDVLISQYYSGGFTHQEPSVNDESYTRFMAQRAKIRAMTLDQYVLDEYELEHIKLKYSLLTEFMERTSRCPNVLHSSYSEMFNCFETWNRRMCEFVGLDNASQLYALFAPTFNFKEADSADVLAGK